MSEAVDGLTWSRSKADLRLYRELFGMSVAELGRLAAVSGRTVRSWEDPRAWVPDRTAWMAVESLWRDADRMASGLAADAAAGPVTLPYGTGASTLACIASRIAAGRLSAAGVAWDASFPHAPGPDGGKARFRLMTDMLHAGGERGAALFGVSRQTVIAWRNPLLAGSVPAMEAWDALDARWKAMVGRASALADMMAGAAVRAGLFRVAGGGAAEGSRPAAVGGVRGSVSRGGVLTSRPSRPGRGGRTHIRIRLYMHMFMCLSVFIRFVDIVSRPYVPRTR